MLLQMLNKRYVLIRPQNCKTPILLIYATLLICQTAWLQIASVVEKDVPQVPAWRPAPWMVDFVQVERLDRSPRPGMDYQDLYPRRRMAFIPRIIPLYTLRHLVQTMHDISLFFRMHVISKDKDLSITSS